jgi:UDP-MurNAc hydroxylase
VLCEILDSDDWERALLSFRLELAREPDVYDFRLSAFLRFGNQPTQVRQVLADRRGSDERIVIDGVQVPRFCPHAGEDLLHAIVRNGTIECPRHHWRWDLATGACLSGGDVDLAVETPVLVGATPGVP